MNRSRPEKQPIHVHYIRSEATLPQVRESLTTYSQPLQAVTVVIEFSKVGRVEMLCHPGKVGGHVFWSVTVHCVNMAADLSGMTLLYLQGCGSGLKVCCLIRDKPRPVARGVQTGAIAPPHWMQGPLGRL